jgi:HEAT repeat protein
VRYDVLLAAAGVVVFALIVLVVSVGMSRKKEQVVEGGGSSTSTQVAAIAQALSNEDEPMPAEVGEEPKAPAAAQTQQRTKAPDVMPPVPEEEDKRPAEEQTRQPIQPKPVVPAKIVLKRLHRAEAEELRKELLQVPEVALDSRSPGSNELFRAAEQCRLTHQVYLGPAFLTNSRSDLFGLPLVVGMDSQLGKEPAEDLHAMSRKLRRCVEASIGDRRLDPRPDPDKLRESLMQDDGKEWLKPEAVPCLLQMLQAENTPVRKLLVEVLGKVPGKRATQALAMRAMVDLAPEVREAAVMALKDRPVEEFKGLLQAGLRYPWAAVVAHAAEALVALDGKEALPALAKALAEPDPSLPFAVRRGKLEVHAVRELVRVNHLANCVLCHAPSLDRAELVRGAVPVPGMPLPAPSTTPQYYETGEHFVRADVTFLRQDFSVMQTVANPGQWPLYQRYDYMVRLRRATESEMRAAEKLTNQVEATAQRELLRRAVREVTGKDPGRTPEEWQHLLAAVQPVAGIGKEMSQSDAGDWKQFLPVSLPPPTHEEPARLAKELVRAPEALRRAPLEKLRDGKGSEYSRALAEAVAQLSGEAKTQARQALAERLARLKTANLAAYLADDDAELRRAAALACALKEEGTLVGKLIDLLNDSENSVRRAAYAALKELTKQDFGPARDAAPAEREQAASAWRAWWKKQTGI